MSSMDRCGGKTHFGSPPPQPPNRQRSSGERPEDPSPVGEGSLKSRTVPAPVDRIQEPALPSGERTAGHATVYQQSRASLMAEFAAADALLEAVRRAREAGYRRLETYAPFAIEGLDEALGLRRTRVPWIMLIFGILGGLSAFLLQWYLAAADYPLNAGGKPYFSWPPFALLAFEFTVLGAALAGFIGMLALNGLPKLYDPVFDAPDFERGSQDRFFLRIDSADPRRGPREVREFLESLRPLAVVEVRDEV
jgi:hypothetical protein